MWNHISLTKPPFRPLGPRPQQVGLDQDDVGLGLELGEPPRRPHPRVAAADDEEVAVDRSLGAAGSGSPIGASESQ